MSKRLFLAVFSFLLVSFSLAQTIDQVRSKVNVLVSKNEIQEAIPLLKRCLFFSDSIYQVDMLIQLGDCYFAIDSFENAHQYFQMGYSKSKNDSVSDEIIFKAVATFLKQKNASEALNTISNGLKIKNSFYFTKKKEFYEALAYLQLHNYGAAESSFKHCFPLDSLNIHSVFMNLSQTKFYNPKKAKTLSKILPGLGQLYAKDYKNSLNSFGLNAGLLTLGVWSAIVYTPFDGIIWVAPWLRRYYVGGYKKAELIAIGQNEKIEKDYLIRLLNLVEKSNFKYSNK